MNFKLNDYDFRESMPSKILGLIMGCVIMCFINGIIISGTAVYVITGLEVLK